MLRRHFSATQFALRVSRGTRTFFFEKTAHFAKRPSNLCHICFRQKTPHFLEMRGLLAKANVGLLAKCAVFRRPYRLESRKNWKTGYPKVLSGIGREGTQQNRRKTRQILLLPHTTLGKFVFRSRFSATRFALRVSGKNRTFFSKRPRILPKGHPSFAAFCFRQRTARF